MIEILLILITVVAIIYSIYQYIITPLLENEDIIDNFEVSGRKKYLKGRKLGGNLLLLASGNIIYIALIPQNISVGILLMFLSIVGISTGVILMAKRKIIMFFVCILVLGFIITLISGLFIQPKMLIVASMLIFIIAFGTILLYKQNIKIHK